MKRVLIIGFQGSKKKNFKNHVKMYKKLFNTNTTIYTPGYLDNYDPKLVYPHAEKIEKDICNFEGESILHIFSGGLYPGSLMLKNIILNNNQNKINSMIWESSPVECSICSAANAARIAIKNGTGIDISYPIAELFINLYNRLTPLEMETWCSDFYRTLNSSEVKKIKTISIENNNDSIIPYPMKYIEMDRNIYRYKSNSSHTKAIIEDYKNYKDIIGKNIFNY